MNLGVLFYKLLQIKGRTGIFGLDFFSKMRSQPLECTTPLPPDGFLSWRSSGVCIDNKRCVVQSAIRVPIICHISQSEKERERGRKLLCARIINYVRSEYISGGQSRLAHSSMSLLGWQQNRRGKEKMCASSAVIDRLSSEMVFSDSLISH